MLTIKDLQTQVKALVEAQGWQATSPEERALFLVTEVGEVVKDVLKLSHATDDVEREALKVNLGYELYDVIWNVCDLATRVGIDLEESIQTKSALNQTRQW